MSIFEKITVFVKSTNFIILLIGILSGVYFAFHLLLTTFIAPPIDHWCSPPFNYQQQHYSPIDWKISAVPWTSAQQENHCYEYNYVFQNYSSNNSNQTIIIDNTSNNSIEIKCNSGWYFVHKKMSIIAQVKNPSIQLNDYNSMK